MNSLEDRLRGAYHEAAGTVRPHSVPDLADTDLGRGPAVRRTGRAGSGRPARPRGLGTALTAAAAVAAIAVAASVVATRISGDQHQQPGRSQQAGGAPSPRASAGGSGPLAGGGSTAASPRFIVEITNLQSHSKLATTLKAYDAATGHLTGRLSSPQPNLYFKTIAPLGNNRTFVVAATPGLVQGKQETCGTWLYRFRLTAQGRPTDLTQLLPRQAGLIAPDAVDADAEGTLTASADGNTVAYDVISCKPTAQTYGHVVVLSLRSGITKSWMFRFPAMPESLSLSADGRLLGMISNPSSGTDSSSPRFNSAWVLPTGSSPGQLASHYRQVIGRATAPLSEVLSPNGAVMTAAIPRHSQKNKPGPWQVTLSSTSTIGARSAGHVQVLPPQRTFPGALNLSSDASGRYLLMTQWDDRIQRIDLATAQISTLPRFGIPYPAGIAW